MELAAGSPDRTTCGAWACAAGGSCGTSCTRAGGCVSGALCTAGTCAGQFALGEACASGGDCLSGRCVDGVCCDSVRGGPCDACNLPPVPGQCLPVPTGSLGNPTCVTACSSSGPCAPGASCSGGQCSAGASSGSPCTAAAGCASGHCVHGVCCNAGCAGGCRSYKVPGTVGCAAPPPPGRTRTASVARAPAA
ncbi:MAG: hypothetical protein FJ086_12930, partial [Deltaproteobacteria bacterium]|nr:hypothetical protein [Deltaproteobacteria bacterium]